MKVRDKNTGVSGEVVQIWDGKYTASYYDGEQYNPWRIMVKVGKGHVVNKKMEDLDVIEE